MNGEFNSVQDPNRSFNFKKINWIRAHLNRSVVVKMAVIVSGCLLIIVGFSMYILNQMQAGEIQKNSQSNLEKLNTVLKKSIIFSMSEGLTSISPFTKMFDDVKEIKAIRVTNAYNPETKKNLLPVELETIQMARSRTIKDYEGDAGTWLHIEPILADEKCLECHEVKKGDPMAVMSITYDFSESQRQLSVQKVISGMMALFIILITSGAIILMLNRYLIRDFRRIIEFIQRLSRSDTKFDAASEREDIVGEALSSIDMLRRRLDNIISLTQQISSGNLEVQIDTEEGDDALLTAMTDMREHLKTNKAELQKVLDEVRVKAEYLDNLSFPFYVVDREMNIRHINRMVASLANHSYSACIGRKCYELFRNPHCLTPECRVVRAMETGETHSGETIAHLNGKDTPILYVGTPVKDREGNIIGAMEQIVDQTGIKNVINEIRRVAGLLQQGDLESRANSSEASGDNLALIENFNAAIDTITSPIQEASLCINELAAGNVNVRMNGEYKGGLNQLKQNLNTAIASIDTLTSDVNRLIEGAISGDFSIRADISRHKGTFLKIVTGMNETLNAITSPILEVIKILEQMSEGDLSQIMQGNFTGDHARIMETLNQSLASLNNILIRVEASIEQVTSGSRQVSEASQSVSQGATEQASALEEISASMSEIAAQSRQNADSAGQASQLSQAAREAAGLGNKQMNLMLKAMEEINNSSNQISKIIKVIDEIAFQTNLLALNAAVEAARAGVHGRGFAVVAEEVRNLAQRSAKAAKETSELIEGSVDKAANGARIARETDDALSKIINGISKVNDLVGEISTSSREQVAGLEQISQGLSQIDQVTQSSAANAEESASASDELHGQAQQLREMINGFKLRYDNITADLDMPEDVPSKPAPKLRKPALSETVLHGANGNNGNRFGIKHPPSEINLDDDDFGNF
jgi:methyl-accepting chemotaxis protein